MGSMKVAFWSQMMMNVVAVFIVALAVIPLAFFLVGLWADKHRRTLFNRGQVLTLSNQEFLEGESSMEAA